MRPSFRSLITLFTLLLTMSATQIACSQDDNRVVNHAVLMNMGNDSPNLDLLEFHYGSSQGAGMHMVATADRPIGGPASHGETLMPDEVYVKWIDRTTSKTYEDRVDMRNRLPKPSELKGQTVYFLVDQFEHQLYIYLIPKMLGTDGGANRRKPDEIPNGPGTDSFLKVKTIYPDNSPPRPRGSYSKFSLHYERITDTARIVLSPDDTWTPRDSPDQTFFK